MNSMFARKTLPSLGVDPQISRAPRSGRLLRRASCAIALVVAALASAPAALAQSKDGLPQGHTSDTLPALPPPSAPASAATIEAQPVDVEASVEADYYVDTDPSALSDFREPLSPYGTWVEDPTYGTVWIPSAVVVGADFAPYQTAGHWELTADGDWLWVSDYEWGHVPFHYGRWVWIAGRGWAWIPGRVYAPAWVVWRTSDYGYIGWAPMSPHYYWSGGVAVRFYSSPPSAYVFCPSSHVFHHHVHTYVVRDHSVVRRIGAHSRPYQPASPSVGGGSGQAKAPAQPSGSDAVSPPPNGSQRRVSYPKGPSLAEAKIPAGAEPKMRSSHDPRALTFATKSSTAQWKSLPPSARSFSAAPGRSSMPSDRMAAPGGRHMAPSHGRAVSPDHQGQPSMRSPSHHGGFERAPSHHSGFERAPSHQGGFERAPAPSRGFDRSPAPTHRSQPNVSPPSRSFQPQPSAPSRAPSHVSPSPSPRSSQPSAPAVRSAPSRSSAPAARPSAPSAPSRATSSSSSAPSKSVKSSSSSSSSKSSSRDKK